MKDKSAKERLLRRLSLSDLSLARAELFLRERGFSDDDIRETIVWVQDQGYLNECNIVEDMVRRYLDRGQGPFWIRGTLKQKGFLAKHIDTHLDAVTDNLWYDAACKALAKKNSASSPMDRLAILVFWQRRGFSHSQCQQWIREQL